MKETKTFCEAHIKYQLYFSGDTLAYLKAFATAEACTLTVFQRPGHPECLSCTGQHYTCPSLRDIDRMAVAPCCIMCGYTVCLSGRPTPGPPLPPCPAKTGTTACHPTIHQVVGSCIPTTWPMQYMLSLDAASRPPVWRFACVGDMTPLVCCSQVHQVEKKV